jgi:hypothetical protein
MEEEEEERVDTIEIKRQDQLPVAFRRSQDWSRRRRAGGGGGGGERRGRRKLLHHS